jgi:hypothetical protein
MAVCGHLFVCAVAGSDLFSILLIDYSERSEYGFEELRLAHKREVNHGGATDLAAPL